MHGRPSTRAPARRRRRAVLRRGHSRRRRGEDPRRRRRWRAWLGRPVTGYGLPPEDRPLAVFDALAERFAHDDFRGCAFINTMIEAADRDSAAHQVAAAHKTKVTAYLDELLAAAG